MSSPDLDTRGSCPALQQEWVVGEQRKLVNFDPYIYAIHPDRLDILEADLEKSLAEYLLLSTVGVVTIDPEKGFVHESGALYSEIFRRAIEHYVSNPLVAERFEAEWRGFVRAEQLVKAYLERYGILPPLTLASPPGTVYDVEEGAHTKSLTYALIPLGYDKEQRPQYKLYSVPTTELELHSHWYIVETVADVQASLQLLSESMTEITPNTVVAMPAILTSVEESLTQLAQLLGFPSWEAIEADARASSVLDSAYSQTNTRRKSMIGWSAKTIRQLVADRQSKSEFDALQETLRQVFAAERGSKYADSRYADIDQVILEMEQLFVGNGGDPRYARQFAVQEIQYQQAHWVNQDLSYEQHIYLLANNARSAMLGWIGGNPLARDSYMGTGCGPGGANNLKENVWESRTDLLGNQYEGSTMTDPLANKYESSETTTMDCVTCPFCKETVDAIVTSTTIQCPKCHEKVSKG